jgi:hypothetical protein
MSRSLGAALPPDLVERLSGRDLESKAAKVIQLFTVDAGGWAHPALLSYFEVVALDAGRVRLATYADSTTTANMRRSGMATLVVIETRTAYYVKGRASELASRMRSAEWNAAFECRVSEVLVDEVNEAYEPGAYISGGVTYHSPHRDAALERARVLLTELAALPSPMTR